MTESKIILDVKKNLLTDLPLFLDAGAKERFIIQKRIEAYCTDCLDELEGQVEHSDDFAEFINILYGCQQLDDFGEQWAPTKKKITGWIDFLKKFRV